jgi:hypothetical protein
MADDATRGRAEMGWATVSLDTVEAKVGRAKQTLHGGNDVHMTRTVKEVQSGFGGLPGKRYVHATDNGSRVLPVDDVNFIPAVRGDLGAGL